MRCVRARVNKNERKKEIKARRKIEGQKLK